MTRPHDRPTSTTMSPHDPGRRVRNRRAARTTVAVALLLAGATAVTVGAAAYSRNAAANSPAILPAAADSATLSPAAESALLRIGDTDEENRGRAGAALIQRPITADVAGREVIPGLSVRIGAVRTGMDPMGLRSTTLPLSVTNTGALTRSFDITVVAISALGEVITRDVGTATNLRPGQSAEVQVLSFVDDRLADQMAAASFRIVKAFAYSS